MKKLFLSIAIIAVLIGNSGCGTILGGKITACQKTKPASGKRQIRPAALVGDLFTGVLWLIIDFADGGIYKPCTDNPQK